MTILATNGPTVPDNPLAPFEPLDTRPSVVGQIRVDAARSEFAGVCNVSIPAWGRTLRGDSGRTVHEFAGFRGDVVGFRWHGRRGVVVLMQTSSGLRYVALRTVSDAIGRAVKRTVTTARRTVRKKKAATKRSLERTSPADKRDALAAINALLNR